MTKKKAISSISEDMKLLELIVRISSYWNLYNAVGGSANLYDYFGKQFVPIKAKNMHIL